MNGENYHENCDYYTPESHNTFRLLDTNINIKYSFLPRSYQTCLGFLFSTMGKVHGIYIILLKQSSHLLMHQKKYSFSYLAYSATRGIHSTFFNIEQFFLLIDIIVKVHGIFNILEEGQSK